MVDLTEMDLSDGTHTHLSPRSCHGDEWGGVLMHG